MKNDTRFRLQYITHSNTAHDTLEGALLALRGGCRWVQLRMKGASAEQLLAVGRPLREACTAHGAIFLVDDHVELVEALGADGVHLGKDDMPIAEARRLLGPDRIIGGTANTIDDVVRHWQGGASYIGCGPFRFTTTKERLAPTLGLDGYTAIVAAMQQRGITLPVVAIGGITASDIAPIMDTGIDGIALSGAILNAADPAEATDMLLQMVNKS